MAKDELTVTILGRDYRVACEPSERADLIACARFVDQRMEDLRAGGKVMGADRVAVLAALQITQELFAAKGAGGAPVGELRRRLRDLHALVDGMLAPQEKLFP